MTTEQQEPSGRASDASDGKHALRADCRNCFGLCCVALPFTASADFAVDKAAGTPCHNLQRDFGCGIHSRLRESGYPGCTTYDCFGAGQRVSQHTYAGRDWRQEPDTARQMFEVFARQRQLHELLWYLADALDRPAAGAVHPELRAARDRIDSLTLAPAERLADVDPAEHRAQVNPLLLRTSELVRAQVPGRKRRRRGADLAGARLRGAGLRGADLRGAYLIAADLRAADLRTADLLGADFRNADLAGADLTDSLFLTQAQVNAARGDADTRLPEALARPGHW
nr:pentapeptide repeat-containing protein [Streptomyces oceani]